MSQLIGDLISRQAVLDLIKRKYGMLSHPDVISKFIKLEEEINDMSPVTPTGVKYGKWIKSLTYENICNCSKCGFAGYDTFNYCPNCGLEMVESQENEKYE